MTDLAVYTAPRQTSLELAPQAWKLAEKIANTDFVPTALRNRPEAVLACILAGHEAGVSPMQSLAKIHIIEGRPAMAAELMRALVLQHGHELNYEEVSITTVTAAGKRRGSERWTRVTWTMDDAKRGGLDAKNNWRKWPRAMLIARATAELCRMIFPDVLAGISYTVEELEDGGGVLNGSLVDFGPPEVAELTSAPVQAAPQTARARRAVTRPAPADDPAPAPQPHRGEVPALPGEEQTIEDAEIIDPDQTNPVAPVDPQAAAQADPPQRTNEPDSSSTEAATDDDWPTGDWTSADYGHQPEPATQRRFTGPQLIAMRLDRFGIKGGSAAARAQRIAAISTLVGRQIESSKDLTPVEIASIIDRIDRVPEGGGLADVPAADTTPAPPEPAAPPNQPDVEQWSGDQWRTFVTDRKVTVGKAMNEAHRLGALCAPPVSIGTLDDIAGSGIAGQLLGFIEDLTLKGKTQ